MTLCALALLVLVCAIGVGGLLSAGAPLPAPPGARGLPAAPGRAPSGTHPMNPRAGLARRGAFHIGLRAGCMRRLRLRPVGGAAAAGGAAAVRQGVVYGTDGGSIGLLAPAEGSPPTEGGEALAVALSALQRDLAVAVAHVAGLNPAAFRLGPPREACAPSAATCRLALALPVL